MAPVMSSMAHPPGHTLVVAKPQGQASHSWSHPSTLCAKINGVNLWDDIFRVRDEVDFLRPNGTEFKSSVIKIKVPYNYSTQIDSEMKETFNNLLSNIDNILKPKPVFKDKFDWRKF